MRPCCLHLLFCILCIKKKKMQKATLGIYLCLLCMISSINRKAVQHDDFPKVCSFNNREVDFLTKRPKWNAVLQGKYQGKADSTCTDRVEALSGQLLKFLTVTLALTRVHTHTHTYSFLVSDSRHPAMTWGVSLAASKAALNRQKYLLWQTDRHHPLQNACSCHRSYHSSSQIIWFPLPSSSDERSPE